MAAPRRRRIGHRRRIEDEGDDEARADGLGADDDSPSDASLTEDDEAGVDSDTSNNEDAPPASTDPKKSTKLDARPSAHPSPAAAIEATSSKSVTDTGMMRNGLSAKGMPEPVHDTRFEDLVSPPGSLSAPAVVSSATTAAPTQPQPQPQTQPRMMSLADRRRQDHEDYKRRRDEDPSFVPNRGTFFMHDHRHAGPAANGFRPFGRGRLREGRGGYAGSFSSMHNSRLALDPTISSPWSHDMHESVAGDLGPSRGRQASQLDGAYNGKRVIPTGASSSAPINRTLSTVKHLGKSHVRVYLPHLRQNPTMVTSVPVKQYIKLPDHRPPLRRDKPIRISLPGLPARYIYPAADRSFIFIPRSLRPNHQNARGKPRSTVGSLGGLSRRTSLFGGSICDLMSFHSPVSALSRRSSTAHEHELPISPTGAVVQQPSHPADAARPIVRLPPAPQPPLPLPVTTAEGPADTSQDSIRAHDPTVARPLASDTPPLQQESIVEESRPGSIPMHQPRPQKNISVADIESPTLVQGSHGFQQPFHQQVPVQVAKGIPHDLPSHGQGAPVPTQMSAMTPLSQIPERAIHAPPFQPHGYAPAPFYPQHFYQHPPPAPAQHGYFYPPSFPGPSSGAPAAAPSLPSGAPPTVPDTFTPKHPPEQPMVPAGVPSSSGSSNLVAQEINGMVYYYDASQIAAMGSYPSYSAPRAIQPSIMGVDGMVTPSPDGYYYPQQAPGMAFYSQ